VNSHRDAYQEILKASVDINDKNKDSLVERLRNLTEMIIWGEKHDETFME
jgi:hypothetical protein